MSKQLLHQRNDSSESLQLQEEPGSHASTAVLEGKSTPSYFASSRKYRALLLVVGVVAGVAACAVLVATVVGTTHAIQTQRVGDYSALSAGVGDPQLEHRQQHDDPLINIETKEQLLRKVYIPPHTIQAVANADLFT